MNYFSASDESCCVHAAFYGLSMCGVTVEISSSSSGLPAISLGFAVLISSAAFPALSLGFIILIVLLRPSYISGVHHSFSSSSVFLSYTSGIYLLCSQLYLWVSPFFFFCVPCCISGVHHFYSSNLLCSQLYLWASPFWVKFLHMWPFFNPTTEVVTFRLREWWMLGEILLPAFTRPGNECKDLLVYTMECMCALTRPHFIRLLSSERVLGEWSQNPS